MYGTYDHWKTTDRRETEPDNGRRPAPNGCRVCFDGGDRAPCSDSCRRIEARRLAKAEAQGHAKALRLAGKLLRSYRREGDGLGSPRLVALLARIGELRALRQAARRKAAGL